MMRDVVPSGALALVILSAACGEHAGRRVAEELPAATVRVATVAPGARTASEEIVGTVRARSSATVEAKISSRVVRFPIGTGQRVRAGDLLVELDAREIEARLDQAKAARDQAAGDLQRYEVLLRQEAVTRAEYDAVLARQRIAQATLVEAETLLAYTKVVAPFDGVVVRKHADVGDLAAPGRPLVDLEDPTQLRLEAGVPEALADRVGVGASLRVRVDALGADLGGTVAEIAPAADPGSRTFLAKIDLPPDPGLRAGQFGRAAIPVADVAALRVPAAAVVRRGQLEIVYVVEDGRALLRLVKTGKRSGDEIEIVAGVDPDETIVVEGAAALRDGQPVHVER
jgi:RND family efflux transporter MFP subunit